MIWWRYHVVTMTSHFHIFAKLSNMISVIGISLLYRFEVIWIIQTEVIIRGLIFRILEISKRLLRKTPHLRKRVKPFVCTRYVMNTRIFWKVFLLLFKFMITFYCRFSYTLCSQYVVPNCHVLEFWIKLF